MSQSASFSNARTATLVSFLVPLIFYSLTAARTAQGGDTSEFAWLAYTHGVAHPPGYPLYSLLVKAFAYLPIGGLFFRISLTSVLCGAAAVALVQHLGTRFTQRPWLACVGALAFAFSSPMWRLSGVPEVFALNALLALLVALTSLRLSEQRSTSAALLMGLVFGLGVSNHHTIIFTSPLPLAALVSVQRHSGWSAALRAFSLAAVAGLVGLTPYLSLLYFAAHAGTDALSWGNLQTFGDLVDHFLRKEYGTFRLSAHGGAASPADSLGLFARHLLDSYAYLFAALGFIGIALAWRRQRGVSIAMLIALLLSSVLFLSIQNIPKPMEQVVTRFHLLPMTLFAPFVALGLEWLATRSRQIATLVAILGLGLSVRLHLTAANWSQDTSVERAMTALLQPLEPNAILLLDGDHRYFAMGWVSNVLKVRPDVHNVQFRLLYLRWYYDETKRRIPDFPLPYSPVSEPLESIAIKLAQFAPTYIAPEYRKRFTSDEVRLEPVGFVEKVMPKSALPQPADHTRAVLEAVTTAYGEQPLPFDHWSWAIQDQVGLSWTRLAQRYEEESKPDAARQCMERAELLLPGSQPPAPF